MFFPIAFVACCVVTDGAHSQDSPAGSLEQQVEILSLKLQLAEEQLEKLQKECEALRKENALLKKDESDKEAATEDQFAAGVVWAGVSRASGGKTTRFAISISKRDGRNFNGVVAMESPTGDKIEFPVTGKAPQNGDGLVVIESPMIGRGKLFMRGTLRNGSIALAYSGTNPLGRKNFGSATLSPKN